MIRNLLLNQSDWEKIALIDDEKPIFYNELIQKAAAIQETVAKQRQDVIAIFLPNSGDFVAALFGILTLGRIAFPLNCSMTKNEIIPLLEQVAVKTIITSTKFYLLFEEILLISPQLKIIYVEKLNTGKERAVPKKIDMSADSPMVLLTTSGSIGKSKIVPLSQTNVEVSVCGYLERMNFTEKENLCARYILASPLTSAYGLMILCACLIKGFPLILLKDGFTLDGLYKTAQNHKATNYEGGSSVLFMMEQMIDRPIPYDISQLKNFGFGGSKISGNTLRKLSAAFPNTRFWQGYGMTETAPLITKYANAKMEKLDSVGVAIQNVEVAIDSIDGITKKPYVRGEIIVKGSNVMAGYYKEKENENTVLKQGYLYTGDIGYLDEEGYLYICGRKKNIIITRGFNVHPEEVESCLLESPFVKDCMVYGEEDSSGNEYVCVDIVPISPQIQSQEISHYCSTQLAGYKNPRKIQMVDEIKKATSGKTDRLSKGS